MLGYDFTSEVSSVYFYVAYCLSANILERRTSETLLIGKPPFVTDIYLFLSQYVIRSDIERSFIPKINVGIFIFFMIFIKQIVSSTME